MLLLPQCFFFSSLSISFIDALWHSNPCGLSNAKISCLMAWNENKRKLLHMRYSYWADEMAVRLDNMSMLKSGWFRSQLDTFWVSSCDITKLSVDDNISIYLYIIIIIIISCWQHGYPWPSLATPPYRSSP